MSDSEDPKADPAPGPDRSEPGRESKSAELAPPPGASPGPPTAAPSAFALLRDGRDFRRFVIGQGISLVGLWMQQVAQAVVVVDLAGDAAKNTVMATVTLASSPANLRRIVGSLTFTGIASATPHPARAGTPQNCS